jgi:hypothetical protein
MRTLAIAADAMRVVVGLAAGGAAQGQSQTMVKGHLVIERYQLGS